LGNGLQIAAHVFHRHDNGEIDLSELLDTDKSEPITNDLAQNATVESVEDADFYWVNQNRDVELEGGYLRSQDTKWQRDLTVLEPGDVIFHYNNQAIRACSVVSSDAYQTEMEGGEYYRIDVTTTRLDESLQLAEIKETLQDPDYRQEQSRYPLDKNGNVIQAYLCHLTPEAGQYLLAEADIELPEYKPPQRTNYYWATANPSIWSVDEIADGSEVLYTAYNEKGNKNGYSMHSRLPLQVTASSFTNPPRQGDRRRRHCDGRPPGRYTIIQQHGQHNRLTARTRL